MVVTRKKAREDQGITEISNLPDNVIDNILDCLPLGDAVRTSILSRKWRHHWTRLGNLVMDKTFIENEVTRGYHQLGVAMVRSTYIDAVDTILLLHNGSINKFVLYVPRHCEVHPFDVHFNKWIRFLSHNGVKDITFAFPNRAALKSLTTNIAICPELRRLSLSNCKVYLPNFTGFRNLVSLHLLNVRNDGIDGDKNDSLISSCPLLEKLLLEDYCGPLRVSALRLETFEVINCYFKWLTMENIPNLRTLSIRGLKYGVFSVQPHSLKSFLDLMPNIENITLCVQFFDDRVPLTLTTPLKCLRNLTLLAHLAKDREIMLFALCILRSSPYLETFNLCLRTLHRPLAEDLEANVPFLEEQFSEPCSLNNLVTVKIKNAEGTWAQMALIKLILASSPALETLYLSADYYLNNNKELKLLSELIESSRASSRAKILYSKDLRNDNAVRCWNGSVDRSIFDFE